METATFGKEVEFFLNTPLGKYLVKRSEDEADLAMDMLKRTSPWRKNRIYYLQNRIKVAESFQQWLADAVMDGQQALNILEGD